jgi:hypothetical protein
MGLVEELRSLLGDESARSHQLLGEDLALLPGAAVARAGEAYALALERSVAPALRAGFEREQAALLGEAHAMLRRWNRSLHGRVRGYLELARRCRFAYPWPVAAILGICQVLEGMARSRLYGLAGAVAEKLGVRAREALGPGLAKVGEIVTRASRAGALGLLADGGDDALRRTNRGIFADSVPTVLWGLRAGALRAAGDDALAGALLDGPLPPVFDGECRALAAGLAAGLAGAAGPDRFAALAALTRRHFAREQAIFTHHLGALPTRPEPWLWRRAAALRALPAPVVERGRGGARLVFRPFRLPDGFDLRAHAPRVAALTAAFIDPVVASPASYRVAAEYVVERFGRPEDRALLPAGGAT